MSNLIKTNCILIKKQPYTESSILMQVFSDSLGMTSVLAKGIRKSKERKDFLLNVLNEYEFVLSQSSQSGIHVLKEMSLISEYPTDLPLATWFTALAGAEIISKLILPADEIPQFYSGLEQYINYQKNVKTNAIAIFWRFLLHIYKLLGIPVNLSNCSHCHKTIEKPSGYAAETGHLLCIKCLSELPVSFVFTAEAGYILSLLPMIGNYINDLEIEQETINQINHFFLHYISLQFHKNIHLNSLQFFNPE